MVGSLPIRGAKRKGKRVPPALKDGTDEAAAGVRLSPSAEGGKTVVTGPSRSWPNRGSFSGGRNRAGFTQQHRVSQSKHLAVGSSVRHTFVGLLLSPRSHAPFSEDIKTSEHGSACSPLGSSQSFVRNCYPHKPNLMEAE